MADRLQFIFIWLMIISFFVLGSGNYGLGFILILISLIGLYIAEIKGDTKIVEKIEESKPVKAIHILVFIAAALFILFILFSGFCSATYEEAPSHWRG